MIRITAATLLALSLSCASGPTPSDETSQKRGRASDQYVADIHKMVETDVKGHAPMAGYVLFEEGTANPVGYNGPFGSCFREPRIPERHAENLDLLCNQLRGASVEVEAYANPWEPIPGTTANQLSRARLRVARSLMKRLNVPVTVTRARAHAEPLKDYHYLTGEQVVGVRFGLATSSTESGGASWRSNVENAPSQGLLAHEPFQTKWGRLSTDYLDGRHLVLELNDHRSGHLLRQITIDEKSAKCRERRPRRSGVLATGKILFDAGTAHPVAYTNIGACLSENPVASSRSSLFKCRFDGSSALYLEGHARESETIGAQDARILSSQRLDRINSMLAGSALPKSVVGTRALGADVLDNRKQMSGLLHGVSIYVVNSGAFNADGATRYTKSTGPGWSEGELRAFSRFMKEELETVPKPVTEALIENGCNPAERGPVP